ncbi:NRT1/ PTR family protein 3.1 [Tanacetum coccineum]
MEEIKSKGNKHAQMKKGGIITMPFIFANEVGEKLAVVGFQTNMISYLTQQLHMPLTQAANTLTNFGGTASLTPLLGAFMADSFAGRFWTITIASVIYQIGMICLTLSAVLPKLRPPACKDGEKCQEANTGQLAILYVSLLLTSIGSGGIRPCVVAFGADQFDETDEKQKTNTWKFFNWYYFCMGVSMLVAVTVIVYIQDNVGWGWGLGIPSIAMVFSITGFVIGYPLYRNMDPAGSPFTRLLQVCVAAYKKRKLPMVSDPKLLYENEELDASISITGRLLHTNQMRFLDKAAIVSKEDFTKGVERGISFLTRMTIGFAISVLATLVAGFIEIKRKNSAFAHGLTSKPYETIPISVFWLVPQYSLHGMAEAFMSIGHLEFFYDQAPESMRSTATALFWMAIAAGNYGSTLLVTMVHKMSTGQDGSNWLPDDNLNKGKLEYFYWLLTLLQVVNLVYYLFCAKFYTLKPIEIAYKANEDGSSGLDHGVELENNV